MEYLTYTLLGDGSSDQTLLPIIDWLIAQHKPHLGISSQFGRNLGKVGNDLKCRVQATIRAYPCDLLFIHRDAETRTWEERQNEIEVACQEIDFPRISIIPIRMTEAWLFSDEAAIRSAAGNPQGKNKLELPAKKAWEKQVDPKQILFDALSTATGKTGRALRKFRPEKQRLRVAELTPSFDGLRELASFDQFEKELKLKLLKRN